MRSRLLAFVVWTLLALSSGYWLLKILARPLAVPANALPAADSRGLRVDLSRLFGAAAPDQVVADTAPTEDGRYKLIGLVAPKATSGHGHEGVAVIAVDGRPHTVRIGQALEGELTLMALDRHSVTLGRAGVASQVLKLEPLPAPATGSLPTAATSTGSVTLVPAMPAREPVTPGAQTPPPAVPDVLPPGPNAVPLRDPATR